MEQKTVSIIVPVYNAKNYLDRCISSVIAQEYSNWELILVDDGSKDGSADICRRYMRNDPRIRLICSDHGGTAKARNTALSAAGGDYIAFLDADDAYHPKYLQIMLDAAETYDCDIVMCKTVQGTDASEFLASFTEPDPRLLTAGEALTRLYTNEWTEMIVPYTKVYKKSLSDYLRYPDGRFFEDAATIFRAVYYSKKIVDTGAVLYFYNITPNSSSKTNRANELLDREWALRCHLELYQNEKRDDLLKVFVPFYLQELILIHYKILRSDMPEKGKNIEDMFDVVYRQYKKLPFSKEQIDMFFAFRHPMLSDIGGSIRRDGALKTAAGFVIRKLRKTGKK